MKISNIVPTLSLMLLSLALLSSCLQRTPGVEGSTTTDGSKTEAPTANFEYTLEMPSQELQERFVNEYIAYRSYDPEDNPNVAIQSWYGSFGDIHFLLVFDDQITYHQVYWTDTIAESSFYYVDGQTISVWVNGQFLTMKQAYEQNLITADMIKAIENTHNGKNGSPIILYKF